MFILNPTDIHWAIKLKLAFKSQVDGKNIIAHYEERKPGHHYYAVYHNGMLIMGECMDCDAHKFGDLSYLPELPPQHDRELQFA